MKRNLFSFKNAACSLSMEFIVSLLEVLEANTATGFERGQTNLKEAGLISQPFTTFVAT